MSESRPPQIPTTWTWAARDRYYRDLPGPRPSPRIVWLIGILLLLGALAVVGHPFVR